VHRRKGERPIEWICSAFPLHLWRFIYDCSFGFSVRFVTFRLSMVVFYTDPFHRLLWVLVFIRSARNGSCVSCVWWIVAFDARQETIRESTRNITNCNFDTKRAGSIEIVYRRFAENW